MPRDASGNYTLAAGNPVVPGTVIEADWANTTLPDLADAMTNSLSRNGNGGMLAQFKSIDGNILAPGMSFNNELSLGLYRAAAGDMRAVVDNVDVFRITSANGLQLWNGSMWIDPGGSGSFYLDDGLVTSPSLSFLTDLTKGIFTTGDGVSIATASTERARFTDGGVLSMFVPLRGNTGSAGSPTYSFSVDSTQGLYAKVGDGIALSTDGLERLHVAFDGTFTAKYPSVFEQGLDSTEVIGNDVIVSNIGYAAPFGAFNNFALKYGGRADGVTSDYDYCVEVEPTPTPLGLTQGVNVAGSANSYQIVSNAIIGTCNTSGTAVTWVTGDAFNLTNATYIWINFVKYTIQSINSSTSITLTTSAGSQSGVRFFIGHTSAYATVNVNGTAVTRVRGNVFSSFATTCWINNVKYSIASYNSADSITLSTSAGTQNGVLCQSILDFDNQIVFSFNVGQSTIGAFSKQTLETIYDEAIGWKLQTGALVSPNTHRPVKIAVGGADSVTYNTDQTQTYHAKLLPSSTTSIDLGSSSLLWQTLFARNVNGGGGNNVIFQNDQTSDFQSHVTAAGHVYPSTDNTYGCGQLLSRWSAVYAATGTIVTSDENEKQDIFDLENTEKNIAKTLKNAFKRYRYKDAVAKKGESARMHFGILAQSIVDAFKAEGLNALDYGIVAYEEGVDLQGNIKSMYGVRYDELFAFILASI